jgi:hypothetical protein
VSPSTEASEERAKIHLEDADLRRSHVEAVRPWLVVLGVVAVGALGYLAWTLATEPLETRKWLSPVLVIGVLGFQGYVLVVAPFRRFARIPEEERRFQLSFDEEAVRIRSSQIDTRVAWASTNGVSERSSCFLLHLGAQPVLVPKRQLAPAMQDGLRRVGYRPPRRSAAVRVLLIWIALIAALLVTYMLIG